VITYEGSISAGVRRIEAITGETVLEKLKETAQSSEQAQEKLLEEKRALEKRVEQMKEMLAHAKVSDLESQAKDVKGVKVLAIQVPGMDREQLRTLVDSLRNKLKERGGAVSLHRGFKRVHRRRSHQGPDIQGARRETGRRGGSSCRG